MKRLCLLLLGSKTIIQAARIQYFTCVMRCHTSSPKGKGQNLISSNSVAGAQLPDCWLDNPNVHQLLNPGQLTTPALPKRFSVIFLWAELSQRAPISIINPPLKTVCIFGGRWDAHSYLDSPKNNKKTDNFRNRPPILVLTC